MLVKCIGNEAALLPPDYRATFAPIGCPHRKWGLITGKTYTACGVSFFAKYVLYLVAKEEDNSPEFIPAPLFAVLEGALSRHWGYWAVGHFYENSLQCVFGYPELTD